MSYTIDRFNAQSLYGVLPGSVRAGGHYFKDDGVRTPRAHASSNCRRLANSESISERGVWQDPDGRLYALFTSAAVRRQVQLCRSIDCEEVRNAA